MSADRETPTDPKVVVRRQDPWRPWFGDPAQFRRLVQLCEAVAASRQPPGVVQLIADDGTRTRTGSVATVLPLIDFSHTPEIHIRMAQPRARLLVHCVAQRGMRIETESDDEAWTAQAYARLTEEAGRRRPWWAAMPSPAFQALTVAAVCGAMWGFGLLVIAALGLEPFTGKWWLIAVCANAAVLAAYGLASRLPIFEVHADGGRSRRQLLLFGLLVTTPTGFLLALVVNLLTD